MYDCAQACAVSPCCARVDWNGATNKFDFHLYAANFETIISNPNNTLLRKPVPSP